MQTGKSPLTKELHYFSTFLLIYGVYVFANGLYRMFTPVVQLFFSDTPLPRSVVWMGAIVSLSSMIINLTLAKLAYSAVLKMNAKGWWLSGTLFASWFVRSAISLLQLSLTRIPPNNDPLYLSNPSILYESVFFLVMSLCLLVFLFKNSMMRSLHVTSEHKAGKFGKLLLYGFGVMLLMTVIVMIVTSINAYILN